MSLYATRHALMQDLTAVCCKAQAVGHTWSNQKVHLTISVDNSWVACSMSWALKDTFAFYNLDITNTPGSSCVNTLPLFSESNSQLIL